MHCDSVGRPNVTTSSYFASDLSTTLRALLTVRSVSHLVTSAGSWGKERRKKMKNKKQKQKQRKEKESKREKNIDIDNE